MTEMNRRSLSDPRSGEISLRDLVAPLFRKKLILSATFLASLAVLILVGLLLPPSFRSQMAVLVNRERIDPLVTTESTTQMPANTTGDVTLAEINSEAELLKSQDVLKQVVIATGLYKQSSRLDWLFPRRDEAKSIERAVTKLAKALKVENKTNSNLIQVSYSSPDPQQSYAVLQSLATLYLEKHLAVHRPPGSYEFFAQETQKYHDALQNSELNLRNFSRQQGVAAPDIERSDLAEQVANSTGQLQTAKQAIAADEDRILSDRAQMKTTPQRSATQQSAIPADKLLDDLGADLLAAQTKRTQLALKYDPTYPLVREMDQEIAQITAAITEATKTKYVTETTDRDPTYELLREDLAKSEADLAAQRAGAAALQRGIQSMQAEMVDLDRKALTQEDILRDAKANEDSYLLYLSKREQERTSDALDETRIANVAIAVPPAIPALPLYSMRLVIFVAFGLALLISIGVAYTVDYFDPSFHTPAQVIEMLGIPVVVAVSRKSA